MGQGKSIADRPSDRRNHRRRAVLLPGRLYRGRQVYDCVVANLSTTGARIKLGGGLDPEAVGTLEIGRSGMMPGTVVWRAGGDVGFRFFEPPQRIAEVIGTAYPAVMGGLPAAH